MTPPPPSPAVQRAYRWVAFALLLGWYCKAGFYVPYFRESFEHPIRFDGFPSWLQTPVVAIVIWCLPALAMASIFFPSWFVIRASALMLLVSATVACWHVETFPDATFLSSFWVAAWLVWFVFRARRFDADFVVHARALAACVVAILFLGPAIGKLTPEYWNGQAFLHLYFLQKDHGLYPALRQNFSPQQLEWAATWFSRAVIAGELLLAVAPILPVRVWKTVVGAALVLLVLISTWWLASVVASIFGLVLGAASLGGRTSAESSTDAWRLSKRVMISDGRRVSPWSPNWSE